MIRIPQDLGILQHSLGLDHHGRGQSHRNHFAADPGTRDHDICVGLVWAGMMTMRRSKPGGMWDGMDFFFVTDAGRAWVAQASPPPPKLTRSQRRWLRYLDGGSDMPFGEWIRTPSAKAWEREAAHG